MHLTTTRLLRPLLPHFDIARPCDWGQIFLRQAPLVVEIGFGLGEVLAGNAKRFPQKDFIGIETDWGRIVKALRRFEREGAAGVGNIRIMRLDATVALQRLFNERSIDHLYCLFPCPWPKKKHEKYRLFSHAYLQLINSRLKDGGRARIVTDYYPYKQWIEEQVPGTGFNLSAADIEPQFDTKFEKKWRREGQERFFEIGLLKREHITVPVPRDFVMKNYRLKSFNPADFKLTQIKGEVTIVEREVFYDQEKQALLVHVLVAEDVLTQDFWASIIKQDNGWLIKCAQGHYFFPTPGIALALEHIYKAAQESRIE
jgi:tRNA (guanine-N7-)-methyltransferase